MCNAILGRIFLTLRLSMGCWDDYIEVNMEKSRLIQNSRPGIRRSTECVRRARGHRARLEEASARGA